MNEAASQGAKWGVVSLKELGTNCWLAKRFLKGGRCDRVMECNYPEKATCKAVEAEVEDISRRIINVQRDALKRIQQLGHSIIKLQIERQK